VSSASGALDLDLMRAAMQLDEDPAGAAKSAERILAAAPGHVAASMLLGRARLRAGDAVAAARVFASLAESESSSPVFLAELGAAQLAAGDAAAAVRTLEDATGREPNLAEAWRDLASARAALGDERGCDVAYERFESLAPDPDVIGRALQAFSVGRRAHAEQLLRAALTADPSDVRVRRALAELASMREEYPDAERLLEEALAIAPGSSRARFDLAQVRMGQQRPAEVLPDVDRLLRLAPENPSYRALKASALTLLGRNDLSIPILESLLAEHPDHPQTWLQYGHALRADGRRADAIRAYRESIARLPSNGEAYFSLANLKTFRFEPAETAAMHAQLARTDLRDEDRWHFEFALGKAAEDDARYEESFRHYSRGNELRRANAFYDADVTSAHLARTKRVLTREFYAARAGWGDPAPDPIFIVGLPRSGSTLLEQILASHSQVEGTRELADVPRIAYELRARLVNVDGPQFPETLAALSEERARALGRRYLDETKPYRSLGRAFFIDKMPNNFLYAGLIHLMLPNAKIVDARRHPLGCCFSNFKQHFQKGLHFTYDMTDLARFYRDYVELMAHFETVLPGRILRVHYEAVVANPEREVRRMLDYCGLPFEEQCLRFHENRRTVQTASSEQVRRPIYSEGVDQWKKYEPWLGPLRAALGDVVDSYPEFTT
jgi:predicted Zn-dependent protease